MLGDDEGEHRELDCIGFTVEPAVALLVAVEVVGGEGHKTAVCKLRRKVVVVLDVAFDRMPRNAVASVLADHHRAPLPGLEVFGYEQNAVGDDVWQHVERYFVTAPEGAIVHLPRTRLWRQARLVDLPQDFFLEVTPIVFLPHDVEEVPQTLLLHVLEEELVAGGVGVAQQPLDVVLELFDLTSLALAWVEAGAAIGGGFARERELLLEPQKAGESGQRRIGAAGNCRVVISVNQMAGLEALRQERTDASKLVRDTGVRRRQNLPARDAPLIRRKLRRALLRSLSDALGGFTVLDDQAARRDEGCDFSVAELPQKAPHVAVDRFAPDPLARLKVATHQRCVDSRVHGRGVEREKAALTSADDPDPGVVSGATFEPIHRP